MYCFAWHRFTGVFQHCRAHAYMRIYFSGHMLIRVFFCMAQVYTRIPTLQGTFLYVYLLFGALAYTGLHVYSTVAGHMLTYVLFRHMYVPCPEKQDTIRVNMAHVYSDLIFRVRFLPVCLIIFSFYMCILSHL